MVINLHLFRFLVLIISILQAGTTHQPAFLPSPIFGWSHQKIKEFSSQILRLRAKLSAYIMILNENIPKYINSFEIPYNDLDVEILVFVDNDIGLEIKYKVKTQRNLQILN